MSIPSRQFVVEELPETPVLGVIFGWAPMLPFAFGALAVWLLPGATEAVRLTIVWGGAILAFLAGVRRGLSFRTPGGADWRQIATMLWLYLLSLTALVLPSPIASAVVLAVGFASVAVLDPRAAARADVPLFFARLRPVQMLVPVVSLGLIALRLLVG